MHKLGVSRVLGQLLGFNRWIDTHVPARQGNHREPVLFEQLAQRARLIPKLPQNVRAQLDSPEAHGGNVFDRLPVIAAPGYRGIAKADLGWRRADRVFEVREVDWRGRCGSLGGGVGPGEQTPPPPPPTRREY